MAVERENATVGQSIRMRVEFRFDRTGNLFDPDSIDQIQVLDSDHSTVLETVDLNNVVNPEVGKYYFDSDSSWNTASKKTFDRWKITVNSQVFYLEASTFIIETAAPSIGIASFVALVKLKVQAPTVGLSTLADPADYETLIKEAVKEYSRRKALKKTALLTGDGNAYFSLPSDWEQEFSWIRNIEYPVGEFPPCFIQKKFYRVEEIDTGYVCRFYESGYPGNGNQFYFRYVIRHTVDASSSTIPVADKDSVCNLAASLCCQALAEKYGHAADSSLDADVVNYRTRGDEFASRGKELLKIFDRNIKPETTGFIGEWDIESFWENNNNLLLKRNSMI
jgi:hypothetical protein